MMHCTYSIGAKRYLLKKGLVASVFGLNARNKEREKIYPFQLCQKGGLRSSSHDSVPLKKP
jgi:hypothetical protein